MHGPIGYGPGMHGVIGVLGAIVGFLGTVILIAIVVGVLFFLIRFLIVGTKAAQLYIDKNKAAPQVEPVEASGASPLVEPVETSVPDQASTGSTSGDPRPTSGPKTRKPKS